MKKLAEIQLYEGGGFKGFGEYGLENYSPESGGTLFTSFMSRTIGVITVVAIIWFLFILITGFLSIIGSGGDKQSLEGAKKKITTGIIGLVALVSALFIARMVGSFLGIKDFLNPAALIKNITGSW